MLRRHTRMPEPRREAPYEPVRDKRICIPRPGNSLPVPGLTRNDPCRSTHQCPRDFRECRRQLTPDPVSALGCRLGGQVSVAVDSAPWGPATGIPRCRGNRTCSGTSSDVASTRTPDGRRRETAREVVARLSAGMFGSLPLRQSRSPRLADRCASRRTLPRLPPRSPGRRSAWAP